MSGLILGGRLRSSTEGSLFAQADREIRRLGLVRYMSSCRGRSLRAAAEDTDQAVMPARLASASDSAVAQQRHERVALCTPPNRSVATY